MKLKIFAAAAAVLLLSGNPVAAMDARTAKDFQTIISRIQAQEKKGKVVTEKMRPDGTWSDVRYQDKNVGNWKAGIHLQRMLDMAGPRPDLALKALEGWVNLKPRSTNWHWNCIRAPKALTETMIRIGPDKIPADLKAKVRPLLQERPTFPLLGQNNVDTQTFRVMEGLVYNDEKLVRDAARRLADELKVVPSDQEGLQEDMSYHLHRIQMQTTGYGWGFLWNQCTWGNFFLGTQFAYPPEKIELMYRFLMDGLRWTIWDSAIDYSACGRGMWPGACEERCKRIFTVANKLLPVFNPEQQKNVRQWLKTTQKFYGARVFPNSGYLTYHAPGWHFSVKMDSSDLVGSEYVSKHNAYGLYQGDGATFFGNVKRYKGYPVLIDNRRQPGTTEIQDERSLEPLVYYRERRNKKGYYAVLADYPVAMAAFRLDPGDLQADKVWFVTGSGVTASGSGITSKSKFPVVTCVDQYTLASEQKYPVRYEAGKGSPEIIRAAERRTGVWKDHFKEMHRGADSADMVIQFINHGVAPKNAGYFYTIRMQDAKVKPETKLNTSSPRIHALQAEGRILAAAFVQGTVTLPDGKKIAVKPGVAILDLNGKVLRHEAFRTR